MSMKRCRTAGALFQPVGRVVRHSERRRSAVHPACATSRVHRPGGRDRQVKLVDLASMIASGHEAPVLAQGKRKRKWKNGSARH